MKWCQYYFTFQWKFHWHFLNAFHWKFLPWILLNLFTNTNFFHIINIIWNIKPYKKNHKIPLSKRFTWSANTHTTPAKTTQKKCRTKINRFHRTTFGRKRFLLFAAYVQHRIAQFYTRLQRLPTELISALFSRRTKASLDKMGRIGECKWEKKFERYSHSFGLSLRKSALMYRVNALETRLCRKDVFFMRCIEIF